MKSIRKAYEKVWRFENLHSAHLKARRGKRNKNSVIDFESSLNCNLAQLQKELMEKTYRVGRYKVFRIHEPKERVIMSLPYRDRIVQHSLCDNVLEPLMERILIHDNCASRKGKGCHFGLKRLEQFMREYYKKRGTDGWVLKGDVSNYFYSIDHEILKKHLYRYIEDKDVKWLLDTIIDSSGDGVGLPIGNMTSQMCAIFYLDRLDRFVKEELKIKYYTRYMDDFVLIHEDRQYLRECMIKINKLFIGELNLKINPKSQVLPLKNGVDYLGFHTYLNENGAVIRKLRKDSKDRMKRKMKKFMEAYRKDTISLERIKQCLSSWSGHAKHGNTYRLRRKLFGSFILRRG